MIGLIAKKIDMSPLVLENGDVVGVTWLSVEPNHIAQVKTSEKDGYTAIQLGTGEAKKYSKALQGHLKNLDAKILKEILVDDVAGYKLGDQLDATVFKIGDRVMVTGVSKGKGFSGTIKRHHFKSGPGGHGHDHHRQPGSIGAMGIARVLPGHRMAGHQGADTVTTKNLRIVLVDPTSQRLAIEGAVPGGRNSFVLLRKYA